MRPNRRGNILLLVVVLCSTMLIIAVTFLRTIQSSIDSGKASQRYVLAQGAALAGRDLAAEYIMRDFAAASMQVHKGDGTIVVLPHRTVLEGGWRQPFLSYFRANLASVTIGNLNRADTEDDVVAENKMDAPFTVFWWHGWNYAAGTPFGRWFYGMDGGYTYSDGRGRFYEPEFYNLPSATPVTLKAPTVGVRFTKLNLGAADFASLPDRPDRANGNFYDGDFRQIAGDPVEARKKARYRVRFANTVTDLEGHLPWNGDATLEQPLRLDVTAAEDVNKAGVADLLVPAGDVAKAQRLIRNNDVAYNLSLANRDFVYALRKEHIFLGRGMVSNVDRDSSGRWPVTWPLMFRQSYLTSADPAYWVYKFDNANGAGPSPELYQQPGVTAPMLEGGRPIRSKTWSGGDWAKQHNLIGPQYSNSNAYYALSSQGEQRMNWDGAKFHDMHLYTPFRRNVESGVAATRYDAAVETAFQVNLMTAPVRAVHAIVYSAVPNFCKATELRRITYFGRTDPKEWLDPDNQTPQYRKAPSGTMYRKDYKVETKDDTVEPLGLVAFPGRDLFVKTFNATFAYEPPASTTPVLRPNYHIADARDPKDRYPGAGMAAAYPLPDHCAPDDCGSLVTTNDLNPPGFDIYTTKNYYSDDIANASGSYAYYPDGGAAPAITGVTTDFISAWTDTNHPDYSDPDPAKKPPFTPPTDWLDKYKYGEDAAGTSLYRWNWTRAEVQSNGKHRFRKSYFHDMRIAMVNAIAVTRAQWSSLDGGYEGYWQPRGSSFSPTTLKDPARYQTLADVDRTMLENLGIDADAPAGATVVLGWRWNINWVRPWVLYRDFNPVHNIRSLLEGDLLQYTSPSGTVFDSLLRSRLMELALNDFRLNLLGSSKDYVAGFRPLDFNGDGVTHCSAYPPNSASLPTCTVGAKSYAAMLATDAAALRLDQWLPVAAVQPPGRTGCGEPLASDRLFSLSGNFFIGKSRFYRIVSRGEVWDNIANRLVTTQTLESVLCLDPTTTGASGLNGSHFLYQRWHWDKYRGNFLRNYQ